MHVFSGMKDKAKGLVGKDKEDSETGGKYCAKCHKARSLVNSVGRTLADDCEKGGKHQWVDPSKRAEGAVAYSIHACNLKESAVTLSASLWRTYRFYLSDVETYFQDTWQHWNENYAAAQKIFDSGPQGAAIRTMLHVENASLFKDHVLCTKGEVKSGREFLELFGFGYIDGKPQMHTYVVLADRLLFSVTGASVKDVMSKHALLADAQREVRYSGEFHVQPASTCGDPNQEYRLIIDNNSGTYAPKKDMLPQLKKMLEANFPGLMVEALDIKDPLLEEYRTEVKKFAA